jgi:hypothetical protein
VNNTGLSAGVFLLELWGLASQSCNHRIESSRSGLGNEQIISTEAVLICKQSGILHVGPVVAGFIV